MIFVSLRKLQSAYHFFQDMNLFKTIFLLVKCEIQLNTSKTNMNTRKILLKLNM